MSNRDRLVEVAADLFHRSGYRATSTEEILQASGVARSNLYYHFDGKAELALAVLERWLRIYEAQLVAPSLERADLPPMDRLRELYRRAAASQDPEEGRTGCALGRLGSELAASEPTVRPRLDAYFAGVEERIADLLAERFPEGERTELAAWAHTCVAVLEGGLFLSDLRQDPGQVQAPGAALVGLLDLPPSAA